MEKAKRGRPKRDGGSASRGAFRLSTNEAAKIAWLKRKLQLSTSGVIRLAIEEAYERRRTS